MGNKKNRILSYYSYCIPKPIHIKNKNFGKITPSFGCAGDDSFFNLKLNGSSNNLHSSSSETTIIGVADGCAQWKEDAARYAQQLMLSGIDYLHSITLSDINKCKNLSHKVAEFASNSVNSSNALIGASTLCIVDISKYDNENEIEYKCKLNAYNLGDSGFSIYRYDDVKRRQENECYECIYKSLAQEQGFGIPYQLGSHSTSNSISDGYCLEHFALKSLDIVIVGSDGLWDNMFDNEISALICHSMNRYYKEWKQQQQEREESDEFSNFVHSKVANGDITHRIMKEAYLNSIDKKKQTPWSQTMTETVEMVYDGGKTDDITCALVFIH